MQKSVTPRNRLADLQHQLTLVSSAWTVDNYEELLRFFIRILPRLLDAERCTIYIVEIGTDKIYSMYGTDLEGMQIEPPREGSIVGEAISTGHGIIRNGLNQAEGFHKKIDSGTGFLTRNVICAPIKRLSGQGVTGAIQVLNKRADIDFSEGDLHLLEEVSRYLAMSIENILINQEILRVSNMLHEEIERLGQQAGVGKKIIAESLAMRGVLEMVAVVSSAPVDVLLLGENGTGKELIARMIHEGSDRRDKPFIAVNCAAIPEHLVESELFGYEKGAFTGADRLKIGRLEEANGGTLFLDEIADMPLVVQPKILRAIQEKEGSRLGGNRMISYDFRIISATNKDLHQEVSDGRFREDLFFRLFSVEIRIPPLRDRHDDIIPLALTFFNEVCIRFNKQVGGFSPEVLQLFERYNWPGNVRQLHKEVERLVALTPAMAMISKETCSPELLHVPPATITPKTSSFSLPDQVKELEISLIRQALERTAGNKVKAAELLAITRQGLHKKLKRYKILP